MVVFGECQSHLECMIQHYQLFLADFGLGIKTIQRYSKQLQLLCQV